MRFVLVVFMIFCSCFFWVGEVLRNAQQIFYQLGSSVVLTSTLFFFDFKPLKRNKMTIWIGIFGIYSIFIYLLGGATMGSVVMLNVFIGTLLYFLTLQMGKEHTPLFLKTIIWISILNIIYMAFQASSFDFIYQIRTVGENNGTDLVALLGLKAIMGMWMGLGAVALFYFAPLLSILFLIPMYISKCSGAVLGLVIATLFYFWYKREYLATYLVGKTKHTLVTLRSTGAKIYSVLALALICGSLAYIFLVDSPMGMMGTRPPMWKMALRDTVYGVRNLRHYKQTPV